MISQRGFSLKWTRDKKVAWDELISRIETLIKNEFAEMNISGFIFEAVKLLKATYSSHSFPIIFLLKKA